MGSAQSADTKTLGNQFYATVERWRPSSIDILMAILDSSVSIDWMDWDMTAKRKGDGCHAYMFSPNQ